MLTGLHDGSCDGLIRAASAGYESQIFERRSDGHHAVAAIRGQPGCDPARLYGGMASGLGEVAGGNLGAILAAMAAAVLFGAVHALMPGNGKTVPRAHG